jgi:hypothetical protein
MKKLTILTENEDDMLFIVDLVRSRVGKEIRFIEITEDENAN